MAGKKLIGILKELTTEYHEISSDRKPGEQIRPSVEVYALLDNGDKVKISREMNLGAGILEDKLNRAEQKYKNMIGKRIEYRRRGDAFYFIRQCPIFNL